ncbi:MAG: YihY/virulence factor BrkB family protein [Bryobacteraceae bacterium]
MNMSAKQAISLFKETYAKWSEHHAPRLGASVAFYSILSFAPLLVLITAVIAIVFGHESAQGALVNEARQLIGNRGAEIVQTSLKNAQKPASGVFASVVAFVTLLLGASGVFTELQDALNVIWDVKGQSSSGLFGMIKQRLFSFGMVLSIGFLLLVSLILSAGLAYIGRSFGQLVPMPPFILQAINFVISFGVIAVLFGLMFKYVPAAKIPWRDVLVGAVGTALLFTIGKQLLGLYLGKASVGSTYGAAGSLVAVIVWIYYSAQIFFFGAEFTRVYGEVHGAKKESAAKEPAVQVPSEPKTESAQVVQGADVRMAAAVGSASRVRLPAPTASADASAEAGTALRHAITRSGEAMPLLEPRSSAVTTTPSALGAPRTKPRLPTAAALGFILGRVSGAIGKNKSSR